MDSTALDSFMHGVEWTLALGFLSALASWGFHVFASLFEKSIR